MKRSWIFVSADDPRNAVIAEWAGILAGVEWVMIWMAVYAMPSGGQPALHWHLIVTGVVLILLLVGWRGLICGHPKRLGSLVLVVTNAFVVGLFVFEVIQNFLVFHFF